MVEEQVLYESAHKTNGYRVTRLAGIIRINRYGWEAWRVYYDDGDHKPTHISLSGWTTSYNKAHKKALDALSRLWEEVA